MLLNQSSIVRDTLHTTESTLMHNLLRTPPQTIPDDAQYILNPQKSTLRRPYPILGKSFESFLLSFSINSFLVCHFDVSSFGFCLSDNKNILFIWYFHLSDFLIHTIHLFLIENTAAHSVKVHGDDRIARFPAHRAVFCIVDF